MLKSNSKNMIQMYIFNGTVTNTAPNAFTITVQVITFTL